MITQIARTIRQRFAVAREDISVERRCQACGTRIMQIRDDNGNLLPVDAEPIEGYHIPDEQWFVDRGDRAMGLRLVLHRSHIATCKRLRDQALATGFPS